MEYIYRSKPLKLDSFLMTIPFQLIALFFLNTDGLSQNVIISKKLPS